MITQVIGPWYNEYYGITEDLVNGKPPKTMKRRGREVPVPNASRFYVMDAASGSTKLFMFDAKNVDWLPQ